MKEFESFINNHAGYKHLMLDIIRLCESETAFGTVKEKITSYPGSDVFTYGPAGIMAIMKDFNVIEGRWDREAKEEFWKSTPDGMAVLEKMGPSEALSELFKSSPSLKGVYREILDFCRSGKTMGALEEKFAGNEELIKEKVFVNFCVHELERAGGLRWQGDMWKTTEAGIKGI